MAIEWATQGYAPTPYVDTDWLMGGRGISPYRFSLANFLKKDADGYFNAAHVIQAVSAYNLILRGAPGGYGAGLSFQSQLSGGAMKEMARITADGEGPWDTTAANQDAGLRFHTSLNGTVAEKMRLTADGVCLIGTTAAPAFTSKLRVEGGIETHGVQFNAQPGVGTYFEIVNRGDGGFKLYPSNSSLAMPVTPNGLILIGRTVGTISGGNGANLQIGSGSGSAGTTIHSSSSGTGDIQFSRGITGTDSYRGLIRYAHSTDPNLENFSFWVGAASRVQIGTSMLAPGTDNAVSLGAGAYRFTQLFSVSGSINTSDLREKQDVQPIDDALLDAWADVQLVSHRWIAAVVEKDDDARWHFGLIAQQVRDALAAHGIDGTRYGLLCFDQWERKEQPIFAKRMVTKYREEMREAEGLFLADGSPALLPVQVPYEEEEEYDTGEMEVIQEAGDRWGLRYTEVLIVEAAWQRRERERMQQQLAILTQRVDELAQAA